MKKIINRYLLGLLVCLAFSAIAFAILLYMPTNYNKTYRLTVQKGQNLADIGQKLNKDNIIHSQFILVKTAQLHDTAFNLKAGTYIIPPQSSTWEILKILSQSPIQMTSIRISEGSRFKKMREVILNHPDLKHDTQDWSDEKILKAVAPESPYSHPEGLFFPDTYRIEKGGSDLQVYQASYRAMQKRLNDAWDTRAPNLPYQSPYELLIMASIIEKETGHAQDRADISAVFVNRLNKKMRLQTDPTVIYGMGDQYQGNIRKKDLQTDTPYNTYTRSGLPITPIALVSRAALEAAAHPSDAKYLYFVSKMDGSGKSHFSHTLDEHNGAVRQYILKK